jgi:hypothetical protein
MALNQMQTVAPYQALAPLLPLHLAKAGWENQQLLQTLQPHYRAKASILDFSMRISMALQCQECLDEQSVLTVPMAKS